MSGQVVRTRERVPTGRRGRPSKSMIAAAMERPFCAYLHKVCLNNRLEGHKYCIDHIMNDKTAPFRQCTFVHATSGRRCARAAHKVDRRAAPLCFYHRLIRLNTPPAMQVQLLAADSKRDPRDALIEQLSHHLPQDSPPPTLPAQPVHQQALPTIDANDLNASQNLDDQKEAPPPQSQPPPAPETKNTSTFWDPLDNGAANPSLRLRKTLADFNIKRLSEDLSQLDMPTTEDIALRHNNADSDNESVDNDYDRFKNASVVTEEEAIRTLRDKMIRLRRLYIEQYSHIQYLLKEKRLKYIQAQRLEDDIHGPIYSFRNFPDSPDYPKLQAMLKYHKTYGPESLLQEQSKRRKQNRPATVGPHRHPHSHNHPHADTSTTKNHQAPAGVDTSATPGQVIKSEPIAQSSPGKSTTAPTTSTADHGSTPTKTHTCPENQSDTKPGIGGEASHNQQPGLIADKGQQSETSTICIFSKTPHGCDKPSIPLSPYCRQHILYDNKQVLFRPCAGGFPPCLTPVVSYTRKNKCWLHTAIN